MKIRLTEEQYKRILIVEQNRSDLWSSNITQRQIDVINLLESDYPKVYGGWYGTIEKDLYENEKLYPQNPGGPDPRNKNIIKKELVKRFFNPNVASKNKATYGGKEMTLLEALNRIVSSKTVEAYNCLDYDGGFSFKSSDGKKYAQIENKINEFMNFYEDGTFIGRSLENWSENSRGNEGVKDVSGNYDCKNLFYNGGKKIDIKEFLKSFGKRETLDTKNVNTLIPDKKRDDGYKSADIQKQSAEKLKGEQVRQEKDGCAKTNPPMGGCIFWCNNTKSIFHGSPCDLKPIPDISFGLMSTDGLPKLLINNSITTFNESLRHKKSLHSSNTYMFPVKNTGSQDSFWGGEGKLGDRLKKVKKWELINPMPIIKSFRFFLKMVKTLGDKERDTIEASWESNKQATIKRNEEQMEKERQENIKNYNPLAAYDNIPGTHTMDTKPPSVDLLQQSGNNIINNLELDNGERLESIMSEPKKLSDFQKQTEGFSNLLNFINEHNSWILTQTIKKYNDICGKEVIRGNRKITKSSACKKEGSGVYVSDSDNKFKFSCHCQSHQVESMTFLTSGGGYSNSGIASSVDTRSSWDQYTSTITPHSVLNGAAAITAFLGPWGRLISVVLEVIDGMVYLDEGDVSGAALSIAFAFLPGASKALKVSKGGLGNVNKLLNKGSKIAKDQGETAAMEYISETLKGFSNVEKRAYFEILENINKTQALGKTATNAANSLESTKWMQTKRRWDELNVTNPKLAKETKDAARKEIWWDMTPKERAIYSAAMGFVAYSELPKEVAGEKPKKSQEEMAQELKKAGESDVRCLPDDGVRTCKDCIYWGRCDEEGSNSDASLYNEVLNRKSTATKSQISNAFSKLESGKWE